jgi:sigma-B regulation protein RsbU (phosphoserine phosphatase)
MSYSLFNSRWATRRATEIQIPSQPRRSSSSSSRAHQFELELKVATLQKDYAELHTALVEAAQVHRRLCAPRLLRYDNFEIASEVFAVRHVPGDFVTAEQAADDIILGLGDICGKGLAAGMWITHLVGLVAAHKAVSSEPKTIARGINRDLCEMSSPAPLASLFLGRLDPVTGKLDYCNAGHPPALLLRASGQLELLSEGGPVLGVVHAAGFDQGSVHLHPGDLLLICSDGILESFNDADQEFGRERLEAELRRSQGTSAHDVLFSVLGAVQDFAAPRPLTDDMTLMVVNHTGKIM